MTEDLPIGYEVLIGSKLSFGVCIVHFLRFKDLRLILWTSLFTGWWMIFCVALVAAFDDLQHGKFFPFVDVFVAVVAVAVPWLLPDVSREEVHLTALLLVVVDTIMIASMYGKVAEVVGYPLLCAASLKIPEKVGNDKKKVDELQLLLVLLSTFSVWRFVHSLQWGHLVLVSSIVLHEAAKQVFAMKHE